MAQPDCAFLLYACRAFPYRTSRKADKTPPLPEPPPETLQATEAATRMNLFFPNCQIFTLAGNAINSVSGVTKAHNSLIIK